MSRSRLRLSIQWEARVDQWEEDDRHKEVILDRKQNIHNRKQNYFTWTNAVWSPADQGPKIHFTFWSIFHCAAASRNIDIRFLGVENILLYSSMFFENLNDKMHPIYQKFLVKHLQQVCEQKFNWKVWMTKANSLEYWWCLQWC